MKTFKNLVRLHLLLVFSITGCITSLQTRTAPTDVTTVTSDIVLSLSTPSGTYTSEDAIPLKLNIQNGKSELLVPLVNIAKSRVFSQLKITDTHGNIVEPKYTITVPSSEETFIEKDGKSIQCVQGLALKKSGTQDISLEDLRKYHQLQKGSYTVELVMKLPVYQDFLKKKHPEVVELEEEIKRIKKVTDAHVSPADKRSATIDLQQQIDRLEEKHKDIYLPVKSLLGEASLTSNSLVLDIE